MFGKYDGFAFQYQDTTNLNIFGQPPWFWKVKIYTEQQEQEILGSVRSNNMQWDVKG